MASVYHPLGLLLASQTPATSTVTLTLLGVERVIGRPRPWLAVSWQVARLSMRGVTPTVTFARYTLHTTVSRLACRC